MTNRQRIHLLLLGAAAAALAVAIADESITLQIYPTGSEQYKALGDNLFLTCAATGGSPHLISDLQWLDPQGASISKTNRVHSEKSPDKTLLFIKNIKEEDTGTYKCTAKYAGSQELFAEVTLSTFMDITWKDAPEEQHLVVNTNGKIKCDVQAQPQPTVDWTKDGQQFKPNDRCINENDGILCRPVLQQDEGHYTCRARVSSTGRMSERNIRVEVDTPPKIDSLQMEYNAIEDGKVTMTCSATGKPVPTVSWVKKDTVDLSKQPGYTVDERAGVLTIEQVSRDDHGMFTCVAKNIAGEDMKETKLNVVSKPKIKEFESITAEKNGKAQLLCRVYAEPLPEIFITKKDSQRLYEANQQYDDRIIVELIQEGFDMIFKVTIRETRDEDDGFYNCEAKNSGGITSATAHLTVEHAPTFDEKGPILVKSWEHHAVNLTCVAKSIPNATVEWYSMNRDIAIDPNIRKFGTGPVSLLEVRTTGNIYYMEYRCKATNKLGVRELIFRIEEAFAPKEIKQADFKTLTATTVSFLLVGPDDNGGMPISHYIVKYTEDQGETKERSWPVADHAYILDKLVPEKKYTFKFAASNSVGTGFFAQTKSVMMPRKGAPEEPQIIVHNTHRPVMSPYPDRITIQWKIPEDNGERIDHFEVTYAPYPDGSTAVQSGNAIKIQDPSSTQIELTNLMPNTRYKVEVRAHNSIGNSYPGQIDIKTAQGIVRDQQQLQKASAVSLEIIIGILVAVAIVLLIVIDAVCYFTNKCGILMCLCVHVCGKEHDPEKEKDGIIGSGKNNEKDMFASNGDVKMEPCIGVNGELTDDKEKEALKDSIDNDVHGKSPHGSRSSIAKDSPV